MKQLVKAGLNLSGQQVGSKYSSSIVQDKYSTGAVVQMIQEFSKDFDEFNCIFAQMDEKQMEQMHVFWH